MIKDKERVKEELRKTILKGCDPYYEFESACDHGIDWTVLTREEFDTISKESKEERDSKIRK